MSGRFFGLAPVEGAENQVHRQWTELARRLQAQAEQETGSAERPANPFEACLLPLLETLNWHGAERQLFEALPHLEQMAGIDDLRAVLNHLNFRTTRSGARLEMLSEDAFPCLLETGEDVFVCLSPNMDGTVNAFSGRSGKNVVLGTQQARQGQLYVIRKHDADEELLTVRKDGWFNGILRRFGRIVAYILVLGFLSNVLALALPIFVMATYDRVIGAKSPQLLITFLIGMGVIICADMVLRAMKGRLQAYVGGRLDAIVGNSTFQQLLHLPLSMTNSASIGSQINRLRQFESIRDLFQGSLISALVDIPFSVIFIIALAVIAGPLALLPAGLLFVYAALGYFAIGKVKRLTEQTGNAKLALNNLTLETLSKQSTLRDLSAEEMWLQRYREASADFQVKNVHARQFSQAMQVVSQMIMTICGILVLGFGALMVLSGDLSPGGLIAVMALCWRVLNPMTQAFLSLTQVGQIRRKISQINALMKLDLERRPGKASPVPRAFRGNLAIRGASLRYPARQEVVLKGINFSAEAGQVVAVAGPSGAGKSTLLHMMLGLYPPQMGAVLVDGLDIRQLDPGEWRHSVGFAPQQHEFFYGTLAQNLRLADPHASDDRLLEVVAEMGLWECGCDFPEGLETRLTGKFLKTLHDNAKQRIVLCRAFVRRSPIYLLDNPGSSLDFDGDKLLMKKINALKGQSTVVLVTQRPSHMQIADKVIFMNNGTIMLEGPPEVTVPKIMNAA